MINLTREAVQLNYSWTEVVLVRIIFRFLVKEGIYMYETHHHNVPLSSWLNQLILSSIWLVYYERGPLCFWMEGVNILFCSFFGGLKIVNREGKPCNNDRMYIHVHVYACRITRQHIIILTLLWEFYSMLWQS